MTLNREQERLLNEVRKELFKNYGKKTQVCPCCSNNVRMYKRKLYSTMVKGLLELYKYQAKTGLTYAHVWENLGLRAGDFAKLRYWGLVKEVGDPGNAKKTSGYWAITKRGIQFVCRKIRVPKYIFLYCAEYRGCSEKDMIGVIEALTGKNSKFNYNELMKGYVSLPATTGRKAKGVPASKIQK